MEQSLGLLLISLKEITQLLRSISYQLDDIKDVVTIRKDENGAVYVYNIREE